MVLRFETIQKFLKVFFALLGVFLLFHLGIGLIAFDLSEVFHRHIDSESFFIEFAPEIWLTLLSIVLGTLIIVISIASQSNPKLIDYYIGDYPSLVYTCVITLASVENIYLQLNLSIDSLFWNNVIFVNAYLMLPFATIMVIPYAFYILSYTKTSSLIDTIYKTNKKTLESAFRQKLRLKQLRFLQRRLMDTVNQLDDQQGYVNFKEPKGQIINSLSCLFVYYLENKYRVNTGLFSMTDVLKHDISFRTLTDKLRQIEKNGTFFEHKLLRVMSGIYMDLIEKGYHDLASQCGNELSIMGMSAIKLKNMRVIELVLMQFNTYMRFGIKHAMQTKDIRHVFNCVFHYTQLILYLVTHNEPRFVLKSCEYLTYYGREIYKLSLSESHFVFLIDSFAGEIQKILMHMHSQEFDKDVQLRALKTYATIEPDINNKNDLERVRNNTARPIKIALILFYLDRKEQGFVKQLIEDIIDDLRYFNTSEIVELVKNDCFFLRDSTPTFWEYSDRGDRNIYYTKHKERLGEFFTMFQKEVNKKKMVSEKLSFQN